MYLPVDKEAFINYMTRLFPDKFTRKGLGILFDYLERSETQTGIEEAFDPQQIQLAYAESNYCRFTSSEKRFDESIGEGKNLIVVSALADAHLESFSKTSKNT